ncbi:MAG: hypothetical protein V1899_12725 [Planctomycetota bacterium]
MSLVSPSIPAPLSADKPEEKTALWRDGQLSSKRREALLNQCAEWVVNKGLEAPILMFLEMHKPLTTLAAVTYAVSQPPLMLFFGFRRTEELRLLLTDRENVEALMQRIEQFSLNRQLDGAKKKATVQTILPQRTQSMDGYKKKSDSPPDKAGVQ